MKKPSNNTAAPCKGCGLCTCPAGTPPGTESAPLANAPAGEVVQPGGKPGAVMKGAR